MRTDEFLLSQVRLDMGDDSILSWELRLAHRASEFRLLWYTGLYWDARVRYLSV